MVDVKCKVCFAGTDHVYEVGDIMPVSEAEAKTMIAKDFAELVEKPKLTVKKTAKQKKESKK